MPTYVNPCPAIILTVCSQNTTSIAANQWKETTSMKIEHCNQTTKKKGNYRTHSAMSKNYDKQPLILQN